MGGMTLMTHLRHGRSESTNGIYKIPDGGSAGFSRAYRPDTLYLRLKKVIRLNSWRDRLQTLRLEYRTGLCRRQKI